MCFVSPPKKKYACHMICCIKHSLRGRGLRSFNTATAREQLPSSHHQGTRQQEVSVGFKLATDCIQFGT